MNIQKYTQKILDLLLLENYEIEIKEEEQYYCLNISLSPEDSGIVIGKHGEGLDALQKIIRSTFSEALGEKKIIININDYRQQREKRLTELVERGASKLVNTGEKFRLSQLNSLERFFVHRLISEEKKYSNLTSYSIDDEQEGRVLIIDYKDKSLA